MLERRMVWLAAVVVLVGACASTQTTPSDDSVSDTAAATIPPETTIPSRPSVPGDIPDGYKYAFGLGFRFEEREGSEGIATVRNRLRTYGAICPSEPCEEEIAMEVTSTLLVNLEWQTASDPKRLTAANRAGEEAEVAADFPVSLDSGANCLISISSARRISPKSERSEVGVAARMDLIEVGDEDVDRCRWTSLPVLDTDFVEIDTWDCGAQPMVTLVSPDGSVVAEDQILLQVPACPFASILIRFPAGMVDIETIGIIPATGAVGKHVIAAPRPQSGWYHLLWLPIGNQNSDGSGWTDLESSPPYEFPVD